MMASHDQQLWIRILDLTDAVKHVQANDNVGLHDVIAQINTLAETYDRQFDPADDFKEYVATALLKSISSVLGQREHTC